MFFGLVLQSPKRDDWFKLKPYGVWSKENVTRDRVAFQVGLIEAEWSKESHFQYYRQPVITSVVPRYGPSNPHLGPCCTS